MSTKVIKITSMLFASFLILSACDKGTPEVSKSLAEITAIAQNYDGKIVHQPPANRLKEDGWYLVKNGKRRWITDAGWLAKNGFQANAVIEISSADFNAIPEDPMPLE
jgi:hypothetical protein